MPALVTRKFRTHQAKQFREGLGETIDWSGSDVSGSEDSTTLDDHIYLYIGNTTAWSDDNAPPTPRDSVFENTHDSWDSMIAAKKVTQSYTSHVIPRNNWTSGSVYAMYKEDVDTLYSNTANPIHVMTTDFNVYKCMDNANNSTSTSVPTSVSTEASAIEDKYGLDNYKWKFLYTITAAEALKFVTPNYIPCKTLRNANSIGLTGSTGMPLDDGSNQYDIEVNSVKGAIDVYNITDAGSNYLFFTGATVGSTTTTFFETATAGINTTDGIYDGSAIYINNDIRIIDTYVYDEGQSKGQFTLTEALAGVASGSFTVQPRLAVYGDGTGATARCVEGGTSGTLGAVFAGVVGSGYNTAEVKVIQSGTGATGSGGVIVPRIGPSGGHAYDIVEELGGNFIMINQRIEQSESGKFPVTNDFRKVGLIKNPVSANTTHRFTAQAGTQAVTMRVSSINGSNFIDDGYVQGNTTGAIGRIVDEVVVSSGVKDLRLVSMTLGPTNANRLLGTAAGTGSNLTNPNQGPDIAGKPGGFQEAETVTCDGSTATVTSLTAGEFKPYSGTLLYVENRSPVVRASDQTEDIKLIIEF